MNSRFQAPAVLAILPLALALMLTAAHAAEVKGKATPVTKKTAARTPAQHLVLPFIEDDYPKALELARQRKIPIFVDSWAPW
jgi:hypothetical protein